MVRIGPTAAPPRCNFLASATAFLLRFWSLLPPDQKLGATGTLLAFRLASELGYKLHAMSPTLVKKHAAQHFLALLVALLNWRFT